jgi:hypothetical protein
MTGRRGKGGTFSTEHDNRRVDLTYPIVTVEIIVPMKAKVKIPPKLRKKWAYIIEIQNIFLASGNPWFRSTA